MSGWIRWFPKDIRASIRYGDLATPARALYRDLLDYQADLGGPFEYDARKLARQLRYDTAEVEELWPQVVHMFEQDARGFWFNTKCQAEVDRCQEQTERARRAGRASAEARARTRVQATGVPTGVGTSVGTSVGTGVGTGVPTKRPTSPTPTPTPNTDSESRHPPTPLAEPGGSGGAPPRSSGDEPPGGKKKPRGKPRWNGDLPSDWPASLVLAFERFREHREEIRKPLTPTAGKQLLAKLRKWDHERAEAALTHSTENGWTGVHEPKAEHNGRPGGPRLSPANQALQDFLNHAGMSPGASQGSDLPDQLLPGLEG